MQTMICQFSQRHQYYRHILVPFLALLLLLTQFKLHASSRKYDETVSLGSACQSAWQLEVNEVRKWAYPFDWLVTSFDGLVAFIMNRGEGFLERDNLEVVEVLKGDSLSFLHVVDRKYDFHSIHDFFFPDMYNYDKVKDKYERRIQRFFALLESDRKILFVRTQISRNEATYLDSLLHRLYPHLEYTLVAVSGDPDAQMDWGLERVRNFYMQQTQGDWQGDYQKWKEILSQFSVKPAKRKRPDGEMW